MNDDFETVRSILAALREEYATQCPLDVEDPDTPITERDIVAEIRDRLKAFCRSKGYHVHCEIKPAPNDDISRKEMGPLPRIDVVVLADKNQHSWFSSAKKLQDKYDKGPIQARFSSIPVEFFHTAIEVKIQSDVGDAKSGAKKDINTLRMVLNRNPSCNCYFLLLNARGRPQDHEQIRAYGCEKGITVLEYTARQSSSASPSRRLGARHGCELLTAKKGARDMRRLLDSRTLLRENWEIIHHVYDGFVEYTESGLRNVTLPQRHFDVLSHVIQRKPFRSRGRTDDSLRNAVGNWLCTEESGSWRNTNQDHPYKGDNKRLWQDFLRKSSDYSLNRALQAAGRYRV